MKTANWIITPDLTELDDVVSLHATHESAIFEFPTKMAQETGKDVIHDAAVTMGWYMPIEDNDGTVRVFCQRPLAPLDHIVTSVVHSEGTNVTIRVEGFATIKLIDYKDPSMFVEEITLLPREHSYSFECGAWFWFEYLPILAKTLNVEEDQLKYAAASCNVMNSLIWEA